MKDSSLTPGTNVVGELAEVLVRPGHCHSSTNKSDHELCPHESAGSCDDTRPLPELDCQSFPPVEIGKVPGVTTILIGVHEVNDMDEDTQLIDLGDTLLYPPAPKVRIAGREALAEVVSE